MRWEWGEVDDKTTRGRSGDREEGAQREAGPRGTSEERTTPPAHKAFHLFLSFPPDDTSHSSATLPLSDCQIPESHSEGHIITSVRVTICDIWLYVVNVWIPTFFDLHHMQCSGDWMNTRPWKLVNVSCWLPVRLTSLFVLLARENPTRRTIKEGQQSPSALWDWLGSGNKGKEKKKKERN